MHHHAIYLIKQDKIRQWNKEMGKMWKMGIWYASLEWTGGA